MTAMEETMLRAPRVRASRDAGVRRERQVAGRHERRVRLVEAVEQPVRATRATRHAAQVGWVERARGLAGQARAWWTEGTGRAAARRGPHGTPAPTRPAAITPNRDAVHGRDAELTPRHLAAVGRRATWGEDVVTGWCSMLLMLGLYLDGAGLAPLRWVLVLALGATAWWILTREQRPGDWSPRAVPAGYRPALAGVGLALVGMAGDAVWHGLFGVTDGVALLVSPFHLVLFAGVCLLAGSTLRAAWSGPTSARVPGLKAFWPVVLSVTLVVAVAACFLRDASPLAGGTAQVHGLLLHNLLFIGPVLFLLLRWQTPWGPSPSWPGRRPWRWPPRPGSAWSGWPGRRCSAGLPPTWPSACSGPRPSGAGRPGRWP